MLNHKLTYIQQAATQDSRTSTGTHGQVQQRGLAQAKKLPQAALSGCNQPHQAFTQ